MGTAFTVFDSFRFREKSESGKEIPPLGKKLNGVLNHGLNILSDIYDKKMAEVEGERVAQANKQAELGPIQGAARSVQGVSPQKEEARCARRS